MDSCVLQAFSVRLGSLRIEEATKAFPMLPALLFHMTFRGQRGGLCPDLTLQVTIADVSEQVK